MAGVHVGGICGGRRIFFNFLFFLGRRFFFIFFNFLFREENMGGDRTLFRETRRRRNLNISILKMIAGRSAPHLGTGRTTSRTAKIHNCHQQKAGNM